MGGLGNCAVQGHLAFLSQTSQDSGLLRRLEATPNGGRTCLGSWGLGNVSVTLRMALLVDGCIRVASVGLVALRWRSRRQRNQRGAALVEAALVTPLLIVLAFGIIDVGRVIYTRSRNSETSFTEAP